MSGKPRWISNMENRKSEHERISEAIGNCNDGNFHAVPGLSRIRSFLQTCSFQSFFDNYGVTRDEYEGWVSKAAETPKPEQALVVSNQVDEDDQLCRGCR